MSARPWSKRGLPYVTSGLAVLAAGFGALALQHSAAPEAATIQNGVPLPANVSPATAELMGLEGLPDVRARNFRLVDQDGRVVSLSAYRGRPVVLEFMDPHCTDICPIVSREFLDAYHDLGGLGKRVTFLTVNVNPYHLSVSAVRGFTQEQGLGAIPGWHFVTGSLPALRATWKAYGIYVHAPGPNADVQHSSEIYFIDRTGKEAYVATPTDDHMTNGTAYLPVSQQAAWGGGIAEVVRALSAQPS